MAFITLPNELIVQIAMNFDSLKHINALAQTNQHCYAALNRHLYLSEVSGTDTDYTRSLHWATENGQTGTIEKFIEVGAISGPEAEKTIESLLNIAASRGYIQIVTLLIKHGENKCDYMNLYYQNALGEAIKGNQIEVVELLLNGHADLQGTFANGSKAMHLAARYDRKPIIKLLFERGVNLYSLDQEENSALQIAATDGNVKALKTLLKCRFDPNFVDGNGNMPIHGLGKNWRYLVNFQNLIRTRSKSKKTQTQILLEYGADPYAKDRFGFMPLWIASSLNLELEIETLLEFGVDPEGLDCTENDDEVVSMEDLEQVMGKRLVKFFQANGGIHLVHRNGITPLCVATRLGNCEAVELLLKHGANPNVRTQNGDTPLHLAVLSQRAVLPYLLIKNGASIDVQNGDGQSPVGLALKIGNIDLIESLFNAAPSLECIDSTGIHPIFRALEYGHSDHGRSPLLPPHIVDEGLRSTRECQNNWPHWCPCCYSSEDEECERVIGWFLEKGADVSIRDPLGRTMLHQATFQNCTKSVQFLLKKNADSMAKDSFGQIPLHMVCSNKWGDDSEDVFNMLLEAGCDPNWKDQNGNTTLHMAARGCYTTGIRILRKNGRGDFLARNNRGNTPMHEAMGAHGWADEETIFELRKAGTDPNLINYEGQTVWDIARQNPDWEDWLTEALSCEVPEVPESAYESDFETQPEDTAVGGGLDEENETEGEDAKDRSPESETMKNESSESESSESESSESESSGIESSDESSESEDEGLSFYETPS